MAGQRSFGKQAGLAEWTAKEKRPGSPRVTVEFLLHGHGALAQFEQKLIVLFLVREFRANLAQRISRGLLVAAGAQGVQKKSYGVAGLREFEEL